MYLTKTNRSPYYQIVYEVEGKLTTKSTKAKLKSEALKFLSNFEKQLNTRQKTTSVKFSEFQTEYLQFVSVKSQSYQRSILLTFRQFVKFVNIDILLKDIDVRLVEKFINSVYIHSEAAAGLYYRTLKAAFSRAVFWGYIIENPFKKVKLPKIKKSLPVFINEFELNKILEVTKEKYLRVLFLTAFHTGMRLSEIINLKTDAVDFDKRIIIVKNTDTFSTKNRKDRIIPMNDILYNTLVDFIPKTKNNNKTDNNYVFYRIKGIKLLADFVSKKFKKAVLVAGVNSDVHFHSLRHSTASLLAQRGVSLLVIKELLGHSSLHVTEMYSHLQHSNLQNAVSWLGKAI